MSDLPTPPPPAPLETVDTLLHRRTDLSTFLVHFVRDFDGHAAMDNLVSILHSRTIEARSPYGIMRQVALTDPQVLPTQQCVCFTETPLEHAWMMCRRIASRQHQFDNYGIAFPKTWARRMGANPVWYLDQTPGHAWLTPALDELRNMATSGYPYSFRDGKVWQVPIQDTPISKIAPFIEQMGPMLDGGRKEFWWEREWRKVGHLNFGWESVVAAFSPEEDHGEVLERVRLLDESRGWTTSVPRLLDPRWGLERMIAKLTGITDADAGPLPG